MKERLKKYQLSILLILIFIVIIQFGMLLSIHNELKNLQYQANDAHSMAVDLKETISDLESSVHDLETRISTAEDKTADIEGRVSDT